MSLSHFGGDGFTCGMCHTLVDSIKNATLFTEEVVWYFICSKCYNIKQRKEKLQKININEKKRSRTQD